MARYRFPWHTNRSLTHREYSFGEIPDLVIALATAAWPSLPSGSDHLYNSEIKESQYVDFNTIAKSAKHFLTNHVDPNTYWEILNKKLTLMILDQNPVIASTIHQ